MSVLIVILGFLFGLLAGAALAARYLHREIAANLAPRLRSIQLQLDNLQAEFHLALTTRYAELEGRRSRQERGRGTDIPVPGGPPGTDFDDDDDDDL